ncbi:MAG: ABC transporter permease [Bacteroidia bacterium]|nr:ABC transporter permease [Bacteroidia bacterium]
MNKVLLENIIVALRSIRGQLLRTVLTVLIIAFGIMSLVGMLTSIDALEQNISENFSSLGANTFAIANEGGKVKTGKRRTREYKKDITWDEARLFKERYSFPGSVSISAFVSSVAVLQYQSTKTQPNIAVNAGDENYLTAAGLKLDKGRNFSQTELKTAANVILLGGESAENLYGSAQEALGKFVLLGTRQYLVVGVLAKGGSGFGGGRDRSVVIPIDNFRAFYSAAGTSYLINVTVPAVNMMDMAVAEATGVFRSIRKIKAGGGENFDIQRSDGLIADIKSMTGYMAAGAIVIGLVTILGALTGLINILLVSVTERTREIGIRMALGATKRNIAIQFLTESVVICQLGGFFGIMLGILIGNVVTLIIGGSFIVPWLWMTLAAVLCFVVGVVAGLYPAVRAANLDPVEALRHE